MFCGGMRLKVPEPRLTGAHQRLNHVQRTVVEDEEELEWCAGR